MKEQREKSCRSEMTAGEKAELLIGWKERRVKAFHWTFSQAVMFEKSRSLVMLVQQDVCQPGN